MLVGTLTNWIAIQLIFSPVEPKKVGPFILQGLFLKRQKEISGEFSKVMTEQIITGTEVVHTLLHRPRKERTLSMLRVRISKIMESQLVLQIITQTAMGPEGYADLKDAVLETTFQYTGELAEDSAFNKMQAQAVQKVLHEKMSQQPRESFRI